MNKELTNEIAVYDMLLVVVISTCSTTLMTGYIVSNLMNNPYFYSKVDL